MATMTHMIKNAMYHETSRRMMFRYVTDNTCHKVSLSHDIVVIVTRETRLSEA